METTRRQVPCAETKPTYQGQQSPWAAAGALSHGLHLQGWEPSRDGSVPSGDALVSEQSRGIRGSSVGCRRPSDKHIAPAPSAVSSPPGTASPRRPVQRPLRTPQATPTRAGAAVTVKPSELLLVPPAQGRGKQVPSGAVCVLNRLRLSSLYFLPAVLRFS